MEVMLAAQVLPGWTPGSEVRLVGCPHFLVLLIKEQSVVSLEHQVNFRSTSTSIVPIIVLGRLNGPPHCAISVYERI